MTTPGGGGSNEINLAALWIPVMPETSHMGEEMRKAGGEAKRQFEQGFNSSGSSPESIGQSYGSKLTASINKEFKNFELPYGMSGVLDKFSSDIDEKLVNKLRGQASQALQSYRQEWDNLAAAQQRAAEAENKVNQAREGGFNKASIMLPLIQEQTAAQNNLNEAHTKASGALDVYTQKNSALTAELGKVADGGKIMAGIMGGAIVLGAQLAVGAVEKFVEVVAEGFKSAIEITSELAKKTIELGETYEHIGIQITEFSSASGEAFEKLESRAQAVFGTLDVAGNDVGKTMAQFASMLDAEPGPALDRLTKHVTELQGRFTGLKATDLAAIFNAFKIPVEQTDTALASLLQNARGSGQDLGQFASALQGNVALTLSEANLSLGQAGAFMSEMLKMGEPGRQTMTGLASAMKEFGKEGISFGDGMKMAGDKLKELGDTAEGQDFAEKLFGTRNWIVAKDAVQNYIDIVAKGPEAFNASASSVDEFISSTETLGNKFETFRHQAEAAFKPFGDAAKNAALAGLNELSTWFNTHHTEIIGDIKQWGDKLIDFLPTLQTWTSESIRMLGEFASGLLVIFQPVEQILALAGAGMLALQGHFAEAGKLLMAANTFDPGKISDMANTLADKIQGIKIDTDAIKANFDGAADAALRIPPSVGAGIPGQGNAFNPDHVAPGAPGGGSPGVAATSGQGGYGNPGGMGGGVHQANWEAIAAKEGGGQWNITYTTGVPEGGGLQIKPGTWEMYGGRELAPKPYMATKEQQEQIAERVLNGWNGIPGQGPGAWPDTYVGFDKGGAADQGGGNFNPNIRIDTSTTSVAPQWDPNRVKFGDLAAMIDANAGGGLHGADGSNPYSRFVTSGSGHGDDVPALLGKGEYVWDTKTVDKYGWLISALHSGSVKGFGQGGDVGGVSQVIWSDLEDPTVQAAGGDAGIGALYGKMASGGPGSSYSDETNAGGQGFSGHHGHVHTTFNEDPFSGSPYGIADQNTTLGDYSAFPPWVKQLADMYNLDPKTYVGHQVWDGFNHGIDWYPRGKQDMSGQSYTHTDNEALNNFANAAIAVGTGQMQGFTGGLGVSPLGYGTGGPGSTPGGKNGGLYPGLPGQYGGSGTYGGETYDQQVNAAQAVQSAKDRQDDLDYQVGQKSKRIQDIKDQLGQVGVGDVGMVSGMPMPRTPAQIASDDKKRKQLNDELDAATHDLTIAQRDQAEQGGKVSEALRKQQESANKKPTGTQAGGNKDAQSLGSGLLSGIGEELGLGTVFSKSPLDWGIVKLAEGLFNYGNNLGDAIFGQSGGLGGTPGGSQGLSSGVGTGLLGSLGIKMPGASISASPNVVPGAPTPFGTGGPLPGPGGPVNVDQSINISPNVDPTAILAPVMGLQRDQQGAQNGQSFQYAGGVPAQ